MDAVDRRHRILQQIAQHQTIHVPDLATELNVSEMTVRRDIARLERDGFLRRTHGGATAHITRSMELLFNARALENAAAKRQIGMTAANLVEDAKSMFVGMGSTTEQFAMFLPSRDDLIVVTGSLPVASLLGTRGTRVVVLGGPILNDELACVGPVASATAQRYHGELAIVGAAGISAAAGVTELDDEAAEIQRVVIGRCSRLMVIADGSKIGAVAVAAVAPVAAIDLLVTDASANADELNEIRVLGVKVAIAGTHGGTSQSRRPTA